MWEREQELVDITRREWDSVLATLTDVGAASVAEQIYDDLALYQGAPDGTPMTVTLTRRDYWEMVGAIVVQQGWYSGPVGER